jgi:hypothetical protein
LEERRYTQSELDKHHNDFESKIIRLLNDNGFIVRRIGYHDLFPREILNIIRSDPNNPVYLYLRALPDFETFYINDPTISFYVDIKTSLNDHAFIEAFPWAANVERFERTNERTIYFYYKPYERLQKFWYAQDSDVMDKIDKILHRRCKPLPIDIFNQTWRALGMPNIVETDKLPPPGVSGDCAAIILKDDIYDLPELTEFELFLTELQDDKADETESVVVHFDPKHQSPVDVFWNA